MKGSEMMTARASTTLITDAVSIAHNRRSVRGVG